VIRRLAKRALQRPDLIYPYVRDVVVREIRRRYHHFRGEDGIVQKEIQESQMRLDMSDKGISTDLTLNGIRDPIATETY